MITFVQKLGRFFVRDDQQFDHYTQTYQARTPLKKALYLFFYLLPGIIAYLLINVKPVYEWGVAVTGLKGNVYQYMILIILTFGWHIVVPFIVLRVDDKLSIRQSLGFLGISKFDWKGCTYLQVVFFIGFILLTIPYMYFFHGPMYGWLESIEIFSIPDYSIFKSAEALYGFPPLWLFFLFVGNFVGEELYFRGYLQKKSAFLGKHNVWINGALFAIYHFFQIPQTWPLIIPGMVFPLIMQWRKNLWVAVIFHFIVNLVWGPVVGLIISNL
jgi:uncharacterized protein